MLQKLRGRDILALQMMMSPKSDVQSIEARKYTMTQTRVRLWTVNEYHRMFETGIITEDER
jgi:hypothetical protein